MASLARFCMRHRWWVLASWIALVATLGYAASQQGDNYRESYLFAGTESRAAADLISDRFPELPGARAQLVLHDREPIDDERSRLSFEPLLEEVAALDHVAAVLDPWADPSPSTFSADNTTAVAEVVFTTEAADLPRDEIEALVAMASEWTTSRRQVEVGGATIDTVLQAGTSDSERYGIIAAVIILLVVFGSVVAAALPVAVAVAGLGAGLSAVALTSHMVPISSFGPQLAMLLGLGAGIDYALLVVTRYREALESGEGTEDAVSSAMRSAGRPVLAAATIVTLSLLALTVVGVEMVTGMAVGAAIGVASTVVASLTLLPAVLRLIGPRIDRLRVRPQRRSGQAWRRWADQIQRRPLPWALGGASLLLLLAVPALSMRLGTIDASANPDSSTTRRAYDLVAAEFGPGANGPLLIAVDLLPRGDADDIDRLLDELRLEPGVAAVSQPRYDEAGVTALLTVTPVETPDSAATAALVRELRRDVLTPFDDISGTTSQLGGATAGFVDQSELLGGRLPLLIASVVAMSFVLLVVAFRGLLVALKAVVVNLLSVAAGYGVVVAVFQWGWGGSLLGLERPGPIIAFAPILLFAILFGLSMDYEVFLLGRIREAYRRNSDTSRSVTEGLAATGRVITAAAAIMVAIFGSFVLGSDPVLKLFGIGLAASILIDVTIVRAVLVPSTMELMGSANWWLPAWLHRRLGPEAELAPEHIIDLTDGGPRPSPTVVDDPYLVALATGHSTRLNRAPDSSPLADGFGEWPAEVGPRPVDLVSLFQAIAYVEDDNAAVLEAQRNAADAELHPTIDLAVLFSERHRDLAIDRVDELVLLGTPPPDVGQPRTEAANQSLAGRARRTEHLWRAAEQLLDVDRIEIVSATAVRWWLRRSSSQWRELGRCGLLQPEPGVLPPGVHRLYHRIAETEHAGAVAMYRLAELDDPEVARLADRRRSLSRLFRDRLAELDDRSPLPPMGSWTERVPAPVVVGDEMADELHDHPMDSALLDWYRREVADVMAEARARDIPMDHASLDPAQLPID